MISQEKALEYFDRLPSYCIMEWCKYKGEAHVAFLNLEATMKAGKPMLDLSYCMTQALNGNVLYTRQFDRLKYGPCPDGQKN